MSKTMWTPGPWEYTRQVGIHYGISVAGEDRGKPETFGTIAKAGNAANARLIAAAPDMLIALQTIALHASSLDVQGIRELCDAACAKARGEQ